MITRDDHGQAMESGRSGGKGRREGLTPTLTSETGRPPGLAGRGTRAEGPARESLGCCGVLGTNATIGGQGSREAAQAAGEGVAALRGSSASKSLSVEVFGTGGAEVGAAVTDGQGSRGAANLDREGVASSRSGGVSEGLSVDVGAMLGLVNEVQGRSDGQRGVGIHPAAKAS
jgi:hypothetical protein